MLTCIATMLYLHILQHSYIYISKLYSILECQLCTTNVLYFIELLELVPGSVSNGDLRLSGYGSTLLWGRLEIYLDGSWGTVCVDGINIKPLEVACHQMGLGYAINYRSTPYQRYTPNFTVVTFLYTYVDV